MSDNYYQLRRQLMQPFDLLDNKRIANQRTNEVLASAPPSGIASDAQLPTLNNTIYQADPAQMPYFIAKINNDGFIEYADERKQFIIPINSEVRFQLDYGTNISRGAKLLVNKPKKLAGDVLEYTMTQPLSNSEVLNEEFEGSMLDTEYLEMVEPHLGSSQYMMEFRLQFAESGSFFIQITYEDESTGEEQFTKPQYINVEPTMSLLGKSCRAKELSIITVMSRCLGKMNRWVDVLRNQRQLGYNAVHFTPFQVYGDSYSHYSLANQLDIDDYFFDNPKATSRNARLESLGIVMDTMRNEGMLSIVDIVLNHTAHNSEWIREHPDSCYSTDVCPHLWSAWLLDKALRDFSNNYAQKKVPELPCAPYISNETDLQKVMGHIKNRIYEPLKLYEFFLCDVNKVIAEFSKGIDTLDQSQAEAFRKKFEEKNYFNRPHFDLVRDKFSINLGGPNRNGVSVKMPDTAHFFLMANNKSKAAAVAELKTLLCQLNDDWMKKLEGFKHEAYNAIEGTIRYYKLELGRKKITLEGGNMIVDPYFSELRNDQRSKVAHNGWIGGHNCMEDFAYVGWNYLRRTINIWGDCVKLRYGKCPADSPYLWEHMTQYVQDMASVADGFRLDNTHSTPVHVCQYLLQAARSKNKNLFVMAELFTDSSKLDAMFCQKLNLNGLVRELQNRHDAGSTGEYFHKLSCQQNVLGQVDDQFTDILGRKYRVLMPSNPCDILYDVTHDNPSPAEKFHTGRIVLPHLGLSSVADISIASTWGVDYLLKGQIHCVTEERTYPVLDQSSIYQPDPTVYPEDVQNSPREAKRAPAPKKVVKPPTSFEFEFWIEAPNASKVTVAGEFNGWNKESLPLKKQGGSWRIMHTLPIENKAHFQFKFVINGSDWVLNEQMATASDGSGHKNNKVDIPQVQQSLEPQGPVGNMPRSTRNAPSSNAQERVFEDLRYARMKLNRVHEHCNRLNASSFMDQVNDEVITVLRQLPLDTYSDFDTYVSITRFCFFNKGGDYKQDISIELPGFMSEVVFAGYLEIPDGAQEPADNQIYGPKGCKLVTSTQIEGKFCHREKLNEHKEKLNFFLMPPSFTCVLKVKSRTYIKEAIQRLNGVFQDQRLDSMLDKAPTSAINHVLFRCDPEEKDISAGTRGPYGLENYGQFPYAGIASIMHMLKKTKLYNDMGAEIFTNIRAGDWLIDYCVNRIAEYASAEPSIGLSTMANLMREYVQLVKQLPAYLKPKFVGQLVEAFFDKTVEEVMKRRILDDFLEGSLDPFAQKMALAVYQMYGRVPSTFFKDHKDSMCAGLTHFSTGYMRSWGRDTFIALRGLLIVTGFEEDARNTILYFAKVYRHGLLPNLHDGGNNTRFNSRDAPWFFLQAIKDYCIISEEGHKFLDQKFELHFRDDDQTQHLKRQHGRTLTILDLIIDICERHANGIEFREWNAGTKIDACMKDNGFNIKIRCDDKTGFCFGGNKDNCGTWMDKMGSSDITGNRGVPATPRDGAPIELVAMQYSILSWLAKLAKCGEINRSALKVHGKDVKFGDWAQKMATNFERCFWVPATKNEDKDYDVDTKLVNRRGIYKDVYGSSDRYTDYQLRCNICIAMSYAPELFDQKHAQICLENVGSILMEQGCMGIKTLDPKDRQYKGDYINSDDSCGWNYHQGPEWVWPVGFFLKAQLLFKEYESKEDALHDTMKWLLPHKQHILKDRWQGLPELTNSHGSVCHDSCVTQAWSISTLLDAMRDLYYFAEAEDEKK